MQIGNFLGSRKARQTIAAIVALGVVQIPLMSFAYAPASSVQKADHKKKKGALRAARRPVQQTPTATRALAMLAPEAVPAAPVDEPAPAAETPPVVTKTPAVARPPARIPATLASRGGFNWLFAVLGLIGLGGLVAALGSDSNG